MSSRQATKGMVANKEQAVPALSCAGKTWGWRAGADTKIKNGKPEMAAPNVLRPAIKTGKARDPTHSHRAKAAGDFEPN